MKINLQDFQSSMEKKEYLEKKIESKEFLNDDVSMQINTLKYVVELIKNDYKDGKSIKDEKEMLQKYIYNFLLNDILRPTFNDFFVPRTLEYLKENDDVLKKAVEKFIVEKKDVDVVLENASAKISENLDANIDVVIASMLKNLLDFQYVKPGKFKTMQEKIRDGKLSLDDSKEVHMYVSKLLREITKKSRLECYKEVRKSPEKVYKKIMNNFDLIFSVKEGQKNNQSITPLLSKEAFIREVKMAETLEKDTVSINDFLANPFYGVSKENDLLVFASELLSSIDNETSEGLYRRFKDSKTSDFDKEVLIEAIRTKSIVHKDVELRKMLSDRIIKLIEMQDNIGYLDKYNDKNNERLAYFNLDGLIVSKDELIKILKSENFSTEVGVALSTFYINRAAKIVPCFLRSTFILDKNGVFEKLYKNPNMTFDELGLSKEIVRKNMAEYEALSDLINQRCYKKVRANNGEEIDSCDVEKLKAYERFYKGKYGNFTKDCNNVLATHNYKKFFYKIKDFSLSSLIYTVLTKQKNKVINWGYVCVDDNEDKEKILLGFDVPQLNMTLFSHIKKKYLMEAVKNITGDYVIPVYEGAKDFCVLKNGGRITTQVLYPITSAERKFLLKSDKTVNTRNTFVKHLKWLQNSKLKPDFVRDPGSRLYDIDKDKIYSNTDNIKIKNQLTQR